MPDHASDESTERTEHGLVMFCVRIDPALRRRVKLAAVTRGCTIQHLTVEALEAACRAGGA